VTASIVFPDNLVQSVLSAKSFVLANCSGSRSRSTARWALSRQPRYELAVIQVSTHLALLEEEFSCSGFYEIV